MYQKAWQKTWINFYQKTDHTYSGVLAFNFWTTEPIKLLVCPLAVIYHALWNFYTNMFVNIVGNKISMSSKSYNLIWWNSVQWWPMRKIRKRRNVLQVPCHIDNINRYSVNIALNLLLSIWKCCQCYHITLWWTVSLKVID